MWRNVRHGSCYLSRRLHACGLEVECARTDERVTVRPGGPTVRLSGPPGELLLYVFGRQAPAQVELSGPPEAVAAVRRTHFGMGVHRSLRSTGLDKSRAGGCSIFRQSAQREERLCSMRVRDFDHEFGRGCLRSEAVVSAAGDQHQSPTTGTYSTARAIYIIHEMLQPCRRPPTTRTLTLRSTVRQPNRASVTT